MVVYKFKTTPYDHQLEGLKFLLRRKDGGALLCEPRTGKTKIAIDYASAMHLKGEINRVLIFAPVGVMTVWEDEIATHCPVKYRITMWDKKGRKEKPLPRFGQDVLDFVIVNYDAASAPGEWRIITRGPRKGQKVRSKKSGGRYTFKNKIKAWQPQLVILDESHRIKSPTAQKSRVLHQLAPEFPYRLIMTGTVVTKKKRIFDIYSQWKFLNPKRFVWYDGRAMTFADFKENFSITTKRNGYPQWLGNRNEDQLHAEIHKDSFSIRREDCFDLPPFRDQLLHVDLVESAEAYDQMAEDMVARIKTGEITEASIALVQGLRLRQLSGGVAKTAPTKENPEGRLVVIGSEKLSALEDRLEDLMEAEEHVIIGASYKADIQRIAALCRKRKWHYGVVQGGVKPEERRRVRQDFESHDGGTIFIGQPAAASEGIDLRSAAITIWYSLPTSWVHFKQFSDRNALHSGPRIAEFLIASGVDQALYDNLQEDGDVGKKFITNPEVLLRESK